MGLLQYFPTTQEIFFKPKLSDFISFFDIFLLERSRH